ncbi:hypothetical protein U9M48_038003 [Paspalum notatum var. saurae]|uniref:Reverse transcriptase domain-containing protein n=1 Tax=Paspalum notatum var. saurae TaxID=547442 RepID=A0AAQ3UGR9_PASNO
MLAIILSRAKTNGQVRGVVPHLVEGGLSILQYADDTILFLNHDMEQAKNMKMILCMFVELSGLKINFHKSEIFCFGQAKRIIEKKLSNWKGKMLSYGGRLVPRGILKKIDYFRSKFFWQNDNHKKKYRLVKWPLICLPKDQAGLGVHNLEIQNKCLLSKWLFKLCNEEGMWQDLIKNKYLKGKPLAQVENKLGDSYFWRRFMKVKDLFLNLGRFKLVSGNQLRFQEDKWLGNHAFKHVYPNLFNIVRKKHATVAEVFRSSPLNISFKRALVGNKLHEWHNLVANLLSVNLEEGNDTFVWGLHKSGSFSVGSMYNSLINNGTVVSQEIWHLRIPLKIKIFLWFLKRGGGLNKVGMLLAGAAALCWALWLTRNDILFNKCKPKYVLQAVFRGTHWFRLWAQLQRTDDKKEEVVEACKILESSTMELFFSFGWPFYATKQSNFFVRPRSWRLRRNHEQKNRHSFAFVKSIC